MIKTLTSWTNEIDDVDTAVKEILTGLRQGESGNNPFLKNSVGIVSCYSEYIDSGVLAGIAEKLPFPVVGTTTIACACPGMMGITCLVITVLTSNDVEFEAAVSDHICSAEDAPLQAAYKTASEKHAEKPVFMISFVPLLLNVSGDFFVKAFDRITGGIPNFGTIAMDHTVDYSKARTIFGKESFVDRYVFILLYGKIKPSFFIGGISEGKTLYEKAVITAAEGNQILTINNEPVINYLSSLGLPKDDSGNIIGINSFPFILDYKDDTQPVVRIMFAFTPDGHAVCAGDMPVGATLSLGKIDDEEVLATTGKILQKAMEANLGAACMLIFSCVGRYYVLGYESMREMEKVQNILGTRHPWHLVYSGGEICPTQDKNKNPVNRSHNDTFVICLLQEEH